MAIKIRFLALLALVSQAATAQELPPLMKDSMYQIESQTGQVTLLNGAPVDAAAAQFGEMAIKYCYVGWGEADFKALVELTFQDNIGDGSFTIDVLPSGGVQWTGAYHPDELSRRFWQIVGTYDCRVIS